MTPRGIYRQRGRDLEQRRPQAPGGVLRDVERLAAAEADDRGVRWESGHQPIEVVPLERVDEQRPDEAVVEVGCEPRPQVGHRDDEVRAMGDRLELGDQPPAVDRLEQQTHPVTSQPWTRP